MWTTSFLPLCTGYECLLPGDSPAAVAGRRGNPQHFPPCPQARCLFAQVIHRLVHRMVSQQNSRRLAHRSTYQPGSPASPTSVAPTVRGRRSCPRPSPPRLRRRRKLRRLLPWWRMHGVPPASIAALVLSGCLGGALVMVQPRDQRPVEHPLHACHVGLDRSTPKDSVVSR